MTVLTGLFYPLLIFGAGQIIFSGRAQGSLLYLNQKVVGSELIGQNFSEEKYFWPRPSVSDYQPLGSGGSNLSLTDKNLVAKILERKNWLLHSDRSLKEAQIPSDLLYASGSGLDPHISPAAARIQVERIRLARKLDAGQANMIFKLIDKITEDRVLKIIGTPRVNVLKLNIALDGLNFKEIKQGK